MKCAAAALICACTTFAHADPSGPIVRAPDELAADLGIEYELTASTVGAPVSVAHDLWWGVARRFTLGVVHSNRSIDRIAAGAGVCLVRGRHYSIASEPGGEPETRYEACERTYANGGIEGRYLVADGIALRGRALMRDVDPVKPAIALGVLARHSYGRFAITVDPYLRLGLANRDRGNRAAIMLPVWLAAHAGPTTIALRTGIDGELATWRDGWHGALGVAIAWYVTPQLGLALEGGFPSLFGPQTELGRRSVALTLSWSTTPTRR